MNGRSRTGTAKVPAFVLAALLGSASAHAENWRITPSIRVVETLTDNVALAPDDRKQSDLITQIIPAIRIDGEGARLKLNLNYQMNNVLYARESSRNQTQNYLTARSSLEAVENWLFIDANASITQQARSVFGAQSTSSGTINPNRAETRTFQVSPYIRGRVGATTDYQLRYRWTTTDAEPSQFSRTDVAEWQAILNGATRLNPLSWTIDAVRQDIRYDRSILDRHLSRVRGLLHYQADPQWRLTGSAGYETQDYSGSDEGDAIFGGGVEWIPTERTSLRAFAEQRAFADFIDFSFQHRTRATVWRLSDRQSVQTLPNQLATIPAGTAFDLLFDSLASTIPDPTVRQQVVLQQLQQSGIPPDLIFTRNVLTTRVYTQRIKEASVAVLGVRNTLTLTAAMIDTRSVTTGAVIDDFTFTPDIEQRNYTVSWAHKLSPLSSLNVLATRLETRSPSDSRLDSTQSVVRVLLTRQLGRRTWGSLGARVDNFDGLGELPDYREKALIATVAVTF